MSSRSEKSLYNITQEFLKLIDESTNKRIDLNTAATKLGIVKRRIYDITNILEGFGMLKKINVNIAEYIGDETIDVMLENIENINVTENELIDFVKQNNSLDDDITDLNHQLEVLLNDSKNLRHLYLTSEDLVNLPSLQGKAAFAIKAPKDSFCESGRESDGHVLEISSATGRIDIFYINDENDGDNKL